MMECPDCGAALKRVLDTNQKIGEFGPVPSQRFACQACDERRGQLGPTYDSAGEVLAAPTALSVVAGAMAKALKPSPKTPFD